MVFLTLVDRCGLSRSCDPRLTNPCSGRSRSCGFLPLAFTDHCPARALSATFAQAAVTAVADSQGP